MSEPIKKYRSVHEIAVYVGVSDCTIHRAIAAGQLTSYAVRGRRFLTYEDADRWIKSGRNRHPRKGRGRHRRDLAEATA